MVNKRNAVLRLSVFFLVLPSFFLTAKPLPDTRASWREHRQGVFRIIYRSGDRWAAEEVARAVEDVYPILRRWWSRDLPHIPLYLNLEAGRFNGLATSKAVVLQLVPPLNSSFPFGYQHWLRWLILHELIHYFHLNSRPGLASTFADIFGSSSPAYLLLQMLSPSWLVEGLATQGESLAWPGVGRGQNPQFDLLMRSLVLDEAVPLYDQAGLAPLYRQVPGGRHYLLGYYFLDYLRRHYGEDLPRTLAVATLNGKNVALELRTMTGLAVQELYANMMTELRQRYLREGGNLPRRKVFSPSSASATLPVLADDELVYLVAPAAGSARMLRTGKQGQTRQHSLPFRATFSPRSLTGSAGILVSEGWFVQPEAGPASDLLVLRGEKWTRLTHGARLFSPALSPDGRTLLAIQQDRLSSRLVRVSLNNGAVTPLLQLEDAALTQPSWAPAGDKVLLQLRFRHHNRVEIWAFSWPQITQGQHVASGTNDDFFSSFYGPKGDVWFVSRRRDRPVALFRYRPQQDAYRVQRVVEDRIGVSAATVTSDGTVFYQSFVDFRTVLFRLSPDHITGVWEDFSPGSPWQPALRPFSPSPPLPSWSETPAGETFFVGWYPTARVQSSSVALGVQALVQGMLGWDLAASLSYGFASQQPSGSFSFGLGPPHLLGTRRPWWQLRYTGQASLDQQTRYDHTLSAKFLLAEGDAGSGVWAAHADPSLSLTLISSFLHPFPFWESTPSPTATVRALTPGVGLQWQWLRKWRGDWGEEGVFFRAWQGVKGQETKIPGLLDSQRTGYLLAAGGRGDIPLFGVSTLRLQSDFAVDDSFKGAEELLPPPTGWASLPADGLASFGWQHRLAYRLPLFFSEDSPLGPVVLSRLSVNADLTLRHSVSQSAASSVTLYAGSTIQFRLKLESLPVNFNLSFGYRIYSNQNLTDSPWSLRLGSPATP